MTPNVNDLQAHKPKILVADDDDTSRILLRAAISQWDYPVVEASDGEQTWEILNHPDPPKIVILDWMMPKIDGISICHKAKSEMKKGPYIILLTQISGQSNIIRAIDAGADEFLVKPFNHAELRSRILVGHRIVSYENKIREIMKKNNTDFLDAHLNNVRAMTDQLLTKSKIDKNTIFEYLQNFNEITGSLNNNIQIDNIKDMLTQNLRLLESINEELIKYK